MGPFLFRIRSGLFSIVCVRPASLYVKTLLYESNLPYRRVYGRTASRVHIWLEWPTEREFPFEMQTELDYLNWMRIK